MGNSACKKRTECSSDSEDATSIDNSNETVVVRAGSSFGGSISYQSEEGKVKSSVHDAVDNLNLSPKYSPNSSKNLVPTKFEWEGDGENVVVSGTFTRGKEIRLVKLDRGFACIRLLSEGGYTYKFIVDGKECCNPNKPIIEDKAGVKWNFVFVQELNLQASIDASSMSGFPPGSYSQNIPNFSPDEELGLPPFLPVHLHSQLFLLNEVQFRKELNLLPHSKYAPLDHLHVLKSVKDMSVFGSSHLYDKKCVTTLFFTPV